MLLIDYKRADEQTSSRQIEPLGLIFWGKVWTLVAWCQLRNDYRVFRLDRIQQLATTDEKFTTSDEKSLKHYLNLMAENYEQYNEQAYECHKQEVAELIE